MDPQEQQEQQHAMPMKGANWSVDLSSICGNGNDGQNAVKLQKREVTNL
jgi:hypothetical protein